MEVRRGFGVEFTRRAPSRLLGLLAAAGFVVVGAATGASAQCTNFTVTQITGALVPGDTDIGNHGDDLTTTISLPFSWSMYGVPYTSAVVSSNGTVQFATNSTAYTNNCLPSGTFAGPTIFPHWDDQRTDAIDAGIFTSVSGVSPNQIFNIEWRTTYYASGAALNYAVRLYEGQARFDIVYGSIPETGISATVGVQSSNAGPVNQFSCNTGSLGGVQGLSFDCPTSAGPTCSLAVSPTSGAVGNSFLAFATVFPGIGPPSTTITASLDASTVDGGTVPMNDLGSGGDVTAGDGIYTALVTVGPAAVAGPQTLTTTVSDQLLRSSICTTGFFVDDAGETIANAATPNVADGFISGTLHASDADMFLLNVCDPANFSASTVGGTTIDTQLFLFKPNGTGVVFNDDSVNPTTGLQSMITNALTSSLEAGVYYLAISQYDKDPLDASNGPLWLDTCGTSDFDGDGDTGTDLDIEAFFACMGGNCCATCGSADFDADGDTGTDLDIEAFFRVLGGGTC